ncbi:MAG: DegT/DnrJ/EryC1/StrS family aminotransferase, partial [Chthonomonadales bacterium]
MTKLAIDGGNRTRTNPWPTWPIYDTLEEQALLETLHSGNWWSVEGKKVAEFEAKFSAFMGAEHGTCVTNGSAAIEVALRALGIGCGDEVLVPPYTFVATASSVLAMGATPIFVDVEPGSLNIDPNRLEEAITPRTKAIIPVHIGGRPADMDGVLKVANKRGLAVLEDAAQAHGAEWNGRRVGALGDCGTFSFQASKNLNSGEGGIVLSNDKALADNIWSVANVGRRREGVWYEHATLGSNYRLTEFQAAILLAQMTRLPGQIARRSVAAAALNEMLTQIPGIQTLATDPRVTVNAWHLYCF